jgi:hypothetical protein
LKRDYQIEARLPDIIEGVQRFRLLIRVPKSLIVDEFRLNRLAVNKLQNERYECSERVDLEAGMWSPTSTPFTLTVHFEHDCTRSKHLSVVVPEMMARYHLPGEGCFEMELPRLQIDGFDVVTDSQSSSKSLRQCVPTSSPSVIVPILTVGVPMIGCLYLANLVRSVK